MIDRLIAEATECDFKVALETKKPKSWLKSVSAFANGIGAGPAGYKGLQAMLAQADVVKRGVESMWNITGDRVMMALAMTMADKPMSVNMSFQREYAERYEWIKQQFEDIAFSYLTSVIFYEDYDIMQPEQRLLKILSQIRS